MKIIRAYSHHDGIPLFIEMEDSNGKWICTPGPGEDFVFAGFNVSEDNLSAYKRSEIDLLSLFQSAGSAVTFSYDDIDAEGFVKADKIKSIPDGNIPKEFLPDSGFMYSDTW